MLSLIWMAWDPPAWSCENTVSRGSDAVGNPGDAERAVGNEKVWKRGRVRRRHRRAEKPPRSFVDPTPAPRCLRDVILPYHRVVTASLA
ncbi:unnamed protein product, partial [Musa acuminata subsp. burmannicoides]